MANYGMLFGGQQLQTPDIYGSYMAGRQNEQKLQANQQALATGALQQQNLEMKNTADKNALDMSAIQRLAHTARGLAGIKDDAQRNRVYQALLPHLQKLGPDHPWPSQISQQDANDFATELELRGDGQKSAAQIQEEQLKIAQGNLDARNKEVEQNGKRYDRQLDIAQQNADTSARSASLVGGAYPSSVKEWNFYNSLSPEDQKRYAEMKRGDKGYSAGTEKQIFSAGDAYVNDNAAAENYIDLASRYEHAKGKLSSGATAGVKEWVKEFTGNEDEFTAMRKDWAQMKASEVVKNLPPGAASDADVKMALSGFIGNNAQPEEVAAKLRGMAKLRKLNAEYNSFKADYLSTNKGPAGMLNAWQEHAKQLGSQVTTSTSQQSKGSTVPFKNGKGWELHQDANGNKAYVGPNGEIEEVQ